MLEANPALGFRIDELLADGSRVALRAIWLSIGPTESAPLDQIGSVFIHLNEAGLIAERWSAYNPPVPGQSPPTAS